MSRRSGTGPHTARPSYRSDASLWAVTTYFNPIGYRTRLGNYRTFRRHLHLPLLTVELAHDDRFDLGEHEAEIMIRKRARDVLWHKERLLNLAVRALPPACNKVVWIDSDVIFEGTDWARRVAEALDRHAIVHPYSTVYHLAPSATSRGDNDEHVAKVGTSVVWKWLSKDEPDSRPSRPVSELGRGGGAWGLCLATRREIIEEHGLYDACVVGGGDLAILCAALGAFERARRAIHMNHAFARHYQDWAAAFHRSTGGDVGCVENALCHLWHGALEHRRYRERFLDLSRFNYDPTSDLALDEGGCWRWSGDKTEMQDYVRDYFLSRREDGANPPKA